MTTLQVGRLAVTIAADRPRTCGIHGDDTTSGRCPSCDSPVIPETLEAIATLDRPGGTWTLVRPRDTGGVAHWLRYLPDGSAVLVRQRWQGLRDPIRWELAVWPANASPLPRVEWTGAHDDATSALDAADTVVAVLAPTQPVTTGTDQLALGV